MQITVTQFKSSLGKYLEIAQMEDVWITKRGKIIAKLTKPGTPAVDAISGVLEGKVPDNLDICTVRAERLSSKHHLLAVEQEG